MKFEFEKKEKGVLLKRCYGEDERIRVPERLEEVEVTQLAPYIFSRARREKDLGKAVCGDQVKEICLPKTIKTIGNYAFYGCYYLEKLSLYHHTENIAGGAFTGCRHLNQLSIYMEDAEGYCMKDILSELSHEMKVTLDYGHEKCMLLFPEYYEEAVENTPARILETHFHGSGYSYRQCFQDGVFQFTEYDSLFMEAQHLESEDFCIELVMLRLRYPYHLSEEAKGCYQSWLMEHRISAGDWCIEFEQLEFMEYMCTFIDWRESELEELICKAQQKERMELLSFLMDHKHSHFKIKKKTFDFG